MKKKGLLISTIIMVVVLVASLTTATYAWFSATASVKIDSMSLKTTATKGLVIGVKGDTKYGHGQCEWTGTKWTLGADGLGSDINFAISSTYSGTVASADNTYGMVVTKACTPYDGSGKYLLGQVGKDSGISSGSYAFVKAAAANGSSDPDMTSGSEASIEPAVKNIDYIDLELGISASAPDAVEQAYCTIEVKAPQTALGMAAALHYTIIVDGNTGSAAKGTIINNKDVFSSDTTIASGTNGNFGQADGVDTLRFAFEIFSTATSGTKAYLGADQTTPAVKVRIIAWFEGYDNACNNNNTGVGDATMTIHFDYVKAGDTKVVIANNKYDGIMATWAN